MYLDTAYLAKFYLDEPDSPRVREAIAAAEHRVSSAWAIPEMACVLQRWVREGQMSSAQAERTRLEFLQHVDTGVWTLVPLSDRLLRRCSALVAELPAGIFIRAGDAIHLTTARELGEPAIWTNDRHLLAAAPHFGIHGCTV